MSEEVIQSEEEESKDNVVYLSGMYKDWFLDYASYVILERAVPFILDGLKPVQRRILHSLKELDDGRYHKVANLIGNTMKYHPHGDASIGDAMVHFSWTAPWTYFPLSDATSRLLDEHGSPVTHDWYSVSSWAKHGLGPFFQNSDLSNKQLSHMENALHRAKEIRKIIESPWPEGHPRPLTFVLRSEDHDTPSAYKLEGGESNAKNTIMKKGDGRILFESALPTYDIEADYLTPNGHGALLNNVNQIDMILNSMVTALPPKA